MNLHLATTKHSFTQAPLYRSAGLLYTLLFPHSFSLYFLHSFPLPIPSSAALHLCQFHAFKVMHLKRHTLRMINMNAMHLHLIYYGTHTRIAHSHTHTLCLHNSFSHFSLPFFRYIYAEFGGLTCVRPRLWVRFGFASAI